MSERQSNILHSTSSVKHSASSGEATLRVVFVGHVDQTIAGKATPSFEFGTDRAIGTNDRYEVARAHTAQRGNQFYKQAGRKRLSARVELDMGS